MPAGRRGEPATNRTMICTDASVLLLEDDALIALDAEDMLRSLGAREVLVAYTLDAAARFLDTATVDAAMLDLLIGSARSDDVAARLAERCIPFILTSGYGEPDLPPELGPVPVVGKPYTTDALRSAFAALG